MIFHFENELEEWDTQKLSGPDYANSESNQTKEKNFNELLKGNSQELFDASLLSFNYKENRHSFLFSGENYFDSENNLFPEEKDPKYFCFDDWKEESPVHENTRSENPKPETHNSFNENLNSILEEKREKNSKLKNIKTHKAFVNRTRFGKEHDRGQPLIPNIFLYYSFLLHSLA